jgi:DNA-binding MarR family transcriptional regulator
MNAASAGPSPDSARLAADLRSSVSDLVRAARVADRLGPIPASVLDLLDRRGAMTTADLAAGRQVRHQTMAATVKELIDAGLVATRPDPSDARKKLLDLTPEGKSAIDADRGDRVGLLAGALDATLDADERRLLARALTLLDRVAAAVADAAPAGGDRGPISGAW